jgi:hypothetical protein
VWPKDTDVILKCFKHKTLHEDEEQISALKDGNWIWIERLVRSAVTNTATDELKMLMEQLYHFQVQNNLLNFENKDSREALVVKKKQKKKGKHSTCSRGRSITVVL